MKWRMGFVYVVAVLVVEAGQVRAQTIARYNLNIAAGVRSHAIQEIARICGAEVSLAGANDEQLSEIIGPIRGNFTTFEALSKALNGSGWFIEESGNNEVRIVRKGKADESIVVTGVRTQLRKEDSSLLTRTDTPLKDTPGTIVSVTQAVLQSQNTTSLAEAVRNLPGVSFIPGSPSQIGSRGGSTNGTSFTNGLRNSSLGGTPPTIDVDSIEVLKGPSSIVSGTAVAGGLLNVIPKKATGNSKTTIDLGGGSMRYFRGDFDVGGTISKKNRLYWRAVGLAEHAHRLNEGGSHPASYAGDFILGYRDNGWKIDALAQIYQTRTVYGTLYANNDIMKTIDKLNFIDNSHTYFLDKSVSQNLRVEKNLKTSEKFTLRFRANERYQYANESLSSISNGGILTMPGLGSNYFVSLMGERSKSSQLSFSTDIYAKITTGAIKQQIILAFDYTGEQLNMLMNAPSALYPLQPIPPIASIPTSSTPYVQKTLLNRYNYGAVIQDQLTWRRLHLLASLRQSWFSANAHPTPTYTQSINKLLPSGGIVYSATDWMSLYYSYQKGLTPPQPLIRQFNGQPFPPSLTTGHEVGAKFEIIDGSTSITVDYFRKKSNNLALADPLHAGYSIPGPGQQAEGFEISEVGKITPSLFAETGFTYTRSTIAIPLIATPKYTINFWLLKTINITKKDKIDLGFGGNWAQDTTLTHTDPATGTISYPHLWRNYLRFDTAIGFSHGPYKLNLTINNMFNRLNISTPVVDTNLYRGIGRDVRLTLSVVLP